MKTLGKLIDDLPSLLKTEPDYRIKQLNLDLYQHLITDWKQATTLPLSLRKKLADGYSLRVENQKFISKDKKTIKALIELDDKLKVETVLMKHKHRNSICVSSQIGCALKCTFCATGKMGFVRNLTYGEIVSQVVVFARHLKPDKITNIVFMGMGEPFLNFDNFKKAFELLNSKDAFGFGARRFSVSTAGIIEGIKNLSKINPGINLAISLNAPNDQLRSQLMPINDKYPIREVLLAGKKHANKTQRQVMLEYILIKDVNDSIEHAQKLASITKHPFFIINLIPYNLTGDFVTSPRNRIDAFRRVLEESGINVSQRFSFGQDITAACGQLAGAPPEKSIKKQSDY